MLRMLTADGFLQTDPPEIAGEVSSEAWRHNPTSEGSKGLRLYDWARIALPWAAEGGFERWVLIRSNRRDLKNRASCVVFAPTGTELVELDGAAGRCLSLWRH